MADNEEDRSTDDLSEEASPYRLEEHRKKGQVAQSRELSGLIALIAAGMALFAWVPNISDEMTALMSKFYNIEYMLKVNLSDQKVLIALLYGALTSAIKLVLPVGAIAFVIGVIGSYVQVGNIFSTQPITPDLSRINPMKGLKRYFSMKMVLDGLRLVIRATAVAVVAYYLIRYRINGAASFVLSDPSSIVGFLGDSSLEIFSSLCILLLFFAAFDFWLQKWEYGKQVRTTKQESKQEHKEHEGDPLVKARIRSVQREMARKRMMEKVKEADVIVTNPTHIAIAIAYDRENMAAPRVVAKGADFLAQKIKRIAAEANVPRVENVPLARTLYRTVKVGKAIPRPLYQAVAEVLAYVYKMKNKFRDFERGSDQ